MPKFRKTLALILLLLTFLSARAEGQDGLLRVWLKSLGRQDALSIAVQGDYELSGLRFRPGAKVRVIQSRGELWLTSGDLLLPLGPSATFVRGADSAPGEGLILNGRIYPGALTLSAQEGGIRPILSIGVEDYLPGVVGSEMSDSFPIEALKAQAVAARTYAMMKKSSAAGRDYDLVDTPADQAYAGYDPDHKNARAAVRATRGAVGMVDGDLAPCYYTASNGGEIARPGDVWPGDDPGHILRKPDPYDLENPRSLVNRVTFAADLSDCAKLRRMLAQRAGGDILRVKDVVPENPDPASSLRYTALRFTLETTLGEEAVLLDVYEDIKPGLALGLNAGDYERVAVVSEQDAFTLEMRGFGHGVGMSQRGAQQMAGAHGKTWREILAFYYPGMTLKTLTWQEEALPELAALPGTTAIVRVGSALNLRANPGQDAAILAKLADGDSLKVLDEQDGWARVRYGRLTGYVRQEYITIQ